VTEAGYSRLREAYDALPLDHAERPAYRDALLSHLVPLARKVLDSGDDKNAMVEFEEALSLFASTEVFRGGLKHAGLTALARAFVSRYAPRGDEYRVMLGLVVQISLGGDKKMLQERYARLTAWSDEAVVLRRGKAAAGASTIKNLEDVIQHWPSGFVLQELRRRYNARIKLLSAMAARHKEMGAKARFPALFLGGYLMVRAYLRVAEIGEARAALAALPARGPQDEMLAGLLNRLLGKEAGARDFIQVAGFFSRNREDAVALELCRVAARRFPREAGAWRCLGRLAGELEMHLLAMRSLESARRLAPDDFELAQAVARQHQQRLFEMVDSERLDEAVEALKEIERYHAAVGKQFGRTLQPGLGRSRYAVGHGLYIQGRVKQAARLLEKALAVELIPEAVIQLANIRMNLGTPLGAAELLARVEKGAELKRMNPAERLYWEGRYALARGHAFHMAGRADEGRAEYSRAAARWKMLTTLGVRDEIMAEAHVHLAQVLYRLGSPADALDALDRAIAVRPDRKETYADAIALLVTHGHLPEALDAYHLALGRGAVTEYLKSYCSFWVVGLARRAGLEPDPLAMEYISRLGGKKWYARLALLMLGKADYGQLVKQARTVGDRAELYYYEADRLMAAGKADEARAMWKKVLDTRMMGFYEYEMSRRYLELGPPTVHTRPVKRKGATR